MRAKFIKRTVCAVLACSCAIGVGASLAACGDSEADHIVIGVQQTTGNNYNSMCNLLDALSEELNFTYTTVLVDRDADGTLSTYQNAMLSGAVGIISMVDVDAATTRTIVEYCEQYDAYYAGYMTDFANTFANTSSTDAANVQYVKNSDHFLGAVTDGDIAADGGTRGEFLFNELVKSDARKITLCHAPTYAYPVATEAINRIKELVDEWNTANPDDKIEIYVGSGYNESLGSLEIGFSTSVVPDSTVQDWSSNGVEAVLAVNSLGKKLLTPVKNYAPDIDIYQIGWDDDIVDDFPDTIKTLCQTPAETIIYPLVRVLNAARGNSYADEPTDKTETLITGNYLYITTSQELEALETKTMNFAQGNSVEYSLISVEEVKALLAGEEGASFAKLTETIASWTTENLLR